MNIESTLEPLEPKTELKPVDKEVNKSSITSIENESLETYLGFLVALGLDEDASNITVQGSNSIDYIRKSIAPHVGIEPRDMRIDRMLRIVLRLMPKGEPKDKRRITMLDQITSVLPKYKKWMKARLEARHSSAKGNFLEDAKRLGIALDRIPGPGFPVPLTSDDKSLPNSADLDGLSDEIMILVNSMSIPSASGIVVEAV